jgi:putative salt-induced outer membrane protein YdiY
MRKGLIALAALAAIATATAVFADKVQLNNGDVLTGKIVNSDGKQLTLKSDQAGEVKIDLANIKTFSTDEPLDIRLKDGTTFHKKVDAADPGTVTVEKGDTPASNFRLDTVKAINPPPVAWHGNLRAGAMFSRGNTYTDNINAGFDLNRRGESDRFTSTGQYNFGRERDNDTGVVSSSADNWEVKGKFDHFWTPKWYGYVGATVGKDNIQDLNLRFIPSIGIGYQWVESPTLNFNTEGGVAWVYEDYDNGNNKDEISLRLAYHFDRKFNDRVGMFHNLEYLPSIEDWSTFLLRTDVGLRIDITKSMFVEGKIDETYNSSPAPGNEQNDTKYIVAVGWKF